MKKIFSSILFFMILLNLMIVKVASGDSKQIMSCGCPDPDPEHICFNDQNCESIFVKEYLSLYRQLYPEPWVIEIDVIPLCPYGTCIDSVCRSYYDIWIRLFNPVTGQSEEYWNWYQPCETWPCN